MHVSYIIFCILAVILLYGLVVHNVILYFAKYGRQGRMLRLLPWKVNAVALFMLMPVNVWIVLDASTTLFLLTWIAQCILYLLAYAGHEYQPRRGVISYASEQAALFIKYHFKLLFCQDEIDMKQEKGM